MSLISMHGAWLSFSDAPLHNANCQFKYERVCNAGAGESTIMKIVNREQGLDDSRIIYEQDLIVARLQQDPPRNVEGSVYDFVAEGIEEQAEYLKRYRDISRLVMNDPSKKVERTGEGSGTAGSPQPVAAGEPHQRSAGATGVRS